VGRSASEMRNSMKLKSAVGGSRRILLNKHSFQQSQKTLGVAKSSLDSATLNLTQEPDNKYFHTISVQKEDENNLCAGIQKSLKQVVEEVG